MVIIATRLAANLFYAGRQLLSNYMQNEQSPQGAQTNSGPSKSTEYLVHNWLEASFAWFQMAILWHDPLISIGGLSGFLTLFLLLTYFAPRFYATILIALFCYNLIIVWFRHIWPEIRVPPEEAHEEESRLDVDRWTHLHPQLMTIKELGQLTNNLIEASGLHLQKTLKYRREEPVKFCLVICSILSCTAIIGNLIDGSNLLFCLTTALLLAPGIYLHLLPDSAKDFLRSHLCFSLCKQSTISQVKQTLESESSSPLSLASSPSTTTTPPLSLFDQLKQNSSFLLGQESTSEVKGGDQLNTKSEPVQTEVPINSKNLLLETTSNKQNDEEKDSCCHSDTQKATDDLSSNESASLIDFEDDQQDGFVIL